MGLCTPAQLSPSLCPHNTRRAPLSPQSPPGAAWRGLLCHHQRAEVVSCRDEEFEVGCRGTPSLGGVWRNASYIKHWLMLRNHEFWKFQLRNEQNLKLHVAYKSTGTGGFQGPLEIWPWCSVVWSSATTPRRNWEPRTPVRGKIWAFVISREIGVGISASPIGKNSLR